MCEERIKQSLDIPEAVLIINKWSFSSRKEIENMLNMDFRN